MFSKHALRQQMLKLRNQLPQTYIDQCSNSICEKLIKQEQYQQADTILFYIAFRNEVDVKTLIEDAWKQEKRVTVPLVNPRDRSMKCMQIKDWQELKTGSYGILEPSDVPERVINPEEISLVVVPGVAFDERGYRLGYGGGYYDRFFARQGTLCFRIGVAYPEQMVKTVYPEPHDQPLHQIVTSQKIYNI
jgi:5-formyltetrahydrofolate cyclo-ligase